MDLFFSAVYMIVLHSLSGMFLRKNIATYAGYNFISHQPVLINNNDNKIQVFYSHNLTELTNDQATFQIHLSIFYKDIPVDMFVVNYDDKTISVYSAIENVESFSYSYNNAPKAVELEKWTKQLVEQIKIKINEVDNYVNRKY